MFAKHGMENDSNFPDNFNFPSKEDIQRYDELKKIFYSLMNEWPHCFDNTLKEPMYLTRSQIAVSRILSRCDSFLHR